MVLSSAERIVVQATVSQYFTEENFRGNATSLGYDIGASFVPEELKDFSGGIVGQVLASVKKNLQSSGTWAAEKRGAVTQMAKPLVDARLQDLCQLAPTPSLHYPHPNNGLWGRFVAYIWGSQ